MGEEVTKFAKRVNSTFAVVVDSRGLFYSTTPFLPLWGSYNIRMDPPIHVLCRRWRSIFVDDDDECGMWLMPTAETVLDNGRGGGKANQLDISLEDTREDHSLLVDGEMMMIWTELLKGTCGTIYSKGKSWWLWIPLVLVSGWNVDFWMRDCTWIGGYDGQNCMSIEIVSNLVKRGNWWTSNSNGVTDI